ncbi:MAG: hypothetical protein EXS09_08825 [Gemmataceae bacterium]|nr:hypothetical protein [Gemmataceae bacterium]
MTNNLQELNRVLGEMPSEMQREVLNFAMFLQRKHAQGEPEIEDDNDSRYGASGEGFDLMNRWDAVESPMTRDIV